MKTNLVVRICLICLVLVAAAFIVLKMTAWRNPPDSHPGEFRGGSRNYYASQAGDLKRNRKETGKVLGAYSGKYRRNYEAVPVEIIRVGKSDIEIFLVNDCILEPEKQVDVVAKTSGIVLNILVEEGNYVESGDCLAKLDDEESLLALKEAKVRKENAEMIYERALKSFKGGIVSKEDFEDKKSQYELASVELEAKQMEYRYTAVTSPIDGVIVERNIEEGYNIGRDQIMFKVADFDPILAKIYIPEKDINKVEEGQAARIISESLPEAEFMGRVKMVSPVADPVSGTVKATIETENLMGGLLKPGMSVSVFTIVGRHRDALLIPKKALLPEAEANEVFVARDFVFMVVSSEGMNGLAVGDSVVCEQKRITGENPSEGENLTLSGKVVDISWGYEDVSSCGITADINDAVSRVTDKVFETVSFYNGQGVLVSQIKDVDFDVRTRAFKKEITLGFKGGNNVEVLTGLEEGDRVVTVGKDDVGHGAYITCQELLPAITGRNHDIE